ncbi:extracellular solute-binding protein [Paenibacillus silvisoli]|uniref:extracellular solute-binding protein n=1 Tax=Paenibacillus silvisoli TaxID=3110539 RepID=UPI002804E1AA|nr:extracellular solute-binding protein [Paenibacillus silvisoli]
MDRRRRRSGWKRAVQSAALLGAVALTVAACSDTASAPQQESKAGAGNAGAHEPTELTVFVDMPWFWVDAFEGPIPEELTRRTGVKLKVIKSKDDNELPALLSSGHVPDLIYSERLWDRLASPEVSYAWDELIPKYAPELEVSEQEKQLNRASDGHYYTIRNYFQTAADMQSPYAVAGPGATAMAVRADLMEQLGNPRLESLQDLENVLLQVKKAYPDMTPLLLDEVFQWSIYFKGRFGLDGDVYEHEGQMLSQLRNPRMLAYYQFLNRLYREGLLKPENFTYSYDQYLKERNSGNAFAFIRNVYEASAANDAYKAAGQNGARAKLVTAPLSDSFQRVNGTIGWAGIYITKQSKHPDAAIRLMRYLRSEEGQRLTVWGIEGEHWNLSPKGYPVFTEPFLQEKNDNYDRWVQKYGVAAWSFGAHGNIENLATYDEGQPDLMQVLRMEKEHTVYKPLRSFVSPPPSTEEANIAGKVEDLIASEQTNIILAESEAACEAQYKLMVDNAEQLGLRKLEAWMTGMNDKMAQNSR